MKNISRRRKGFSLIELLIALIILGILAAILIPIVSNRTKQARVVTAQTDMEHIGEAEARVAIDTGYYVRIWMLNYGLGPYGSTTTPFNRDFNYPYQVRNIAAGGYFDTNQLFIEPTTGELVAATTSTALLNRLQTNETTFNWNGPYINWHRDSNVYGAETAPTPDGIPDDPWGNNYILFTNTGLMTEPSGNINESFDPYDRLTVVSLGPDGVYGTSDDLVRAVGQ